jgi:hypothetical protein
LKNRTRLTVWKTWLCSNTIPPFEWPRYVRLSAFSRQAYLLYYKYLPPISKSSCHGTLGFGTHKGSLNSSYTLLDWQSFGVYAFPLCRSYLPSWPGQGQHQ